MRINNREELNTARLIAKDAMKAEKYRVLICAGTGCLAGGSEKIYNKLVSLAENHGQTVNVSVEFGEGIAHNSDGSCPVNGDCAGIKKSGCHGFCEMGPLVRIEPLGILYI